MNEIQYSEVEEKAKRAFESLSDIRGAYRTLSQIDDKKKEELIKAGMLFKADGRLMRGVGSDHFWPTGRGIFLSDDKRTIGWVNEEDHLRLISMETGSNLGSVWQRQAKLLSSMEEKLDFAKDPLGLYQYVPEQFGPRFTRFRFHDQTGVFVRIGRSRRDLQILRFAKARPGWRGYDDGLGRFVRYIQRSTFGRDRGRSQSCRMCRCEKIDRIRQGTTEERKIAIEGEEERKQIALI